MKYIEKSDEPDELRDWKIKRKVGKNRIPEWKRLKKEVKNRILKSMLADQGEICCYCCRNISEKDNRHIEHFMPQERYDSQRFDYQNMLVSCQADKKPGEPWHCGYTKGDWFEEKMLISPMDKDCEKHFRYTAIGCIYPSDNADIPASVTIDILNLNLDKLKAMRQEAIDAALKDIEKLSLNDIKMLIEGYGQRDSDGRFTPFCMTLVHILSYFI